MEEEMKKQWQIWVPKELATKSRPIDNDFGTTSGEVLEVKRRNKNPAALTGRIKRYAGRVQLLDGVELVGPWIETHRFLESFIFPAIGRPHLRQNCSQNGSLPHGAVADRYDLADNRLHRGHLFNQEMRAAGPGFQKRAKRHPAPAIFNGGALRRRCAAALLAGVISIFAIAVPQPAFAMNLYDGLAAGNNLEINLNTTISYAGIVRTNNPSARLTGLNNLNGSEGDINFSHGLVSNEFEILSILDIKDGDYGAHFSGEAYVNTSYLGTNHNNQPDTLNPVSVAKNTDFTSATRNVEGLNARALDAFVYGTHHFGEDNSSAVTLKVGRQTLIWGQSLFLSNNGIAAGMAPFDALTSDNNPNAQTQQKIEPVGQVVLTYQVNPVVTLQGYYQFEWQPDYLEAVGAYFSSTDILDAGGERLLFGPNFGALRSKDLSPPTNNGQFGGSVQLTLGNYDLGFFGLRYDSKAPTVYLNTSRFTYNLAYPRDIWIEGTSLSTTLGPVNVAGELSFRQHMNLVDEIGYVTPTTPANANSNPLYPVGDTMAGQASVIYISPGIPLDPGGVTVDGEVGFNHVLKITANQDMISPGRSSTAAEFQAVIAPTYYAVFPNVDLTFPIGLSYTFYGRSMVDSTENHGTGSVNFGINATYKVTWNASVVFNDFIGAANPNLAGEPSIADRNYVLFSVQHSF